MLPPVLKRWGSAGHDGAGVGLHQMGVLEIIVHNDTDLAIKVTVWILLEAVRVIHVIILLISDHSDLDKVLTFPIIQAILVIPDHTTAGDGTPGSAWPWDHCDRRMSSSLGG